MEGLRDAGLRLVRNGPLYPELSVEHNIGFKPLDSSSIVVGSDFALIAPKVNLAMKIAPKNELTVFRHWRRSGACGRTHSSSFIDHCRAPFLLRTLFP